MPITPDEFPVPISEFEEKLIQWAVDELNHTIESKTPLAMSGWKIGNCGCLLSTAISRHNEDTEINKAVDLIYRDKYSVYFGVKDVSEDQWRQFIEFGGGFSIPNQCLTDHENIEEVQRYLKIADDHERSFGPHTSRTCILGRIAVHLFLLHKGKGVWRNNQS